MRQYFVQTGYSKIKIISLVLWGCNKLEILFNLYPCEFGLSLSVN